MKYTLALCFLFLSVISAKGWAEDSHDKEWRRSISPFLTQYCMDCHQGDTSSGSLDFEHLHNDLANEENARLWLLVHDRIAKGEMPPADAEHSSHEDSSKVLRALSSALIEGERARRDVVLRRLNRNEYENSVRDLFGIKVRVKQLLPNDSPVAGFDNVGEGLAISPEAMQAYLRAADRVLDAVFGPTEQPKQILHETNLLEQKTHDGKIIDQQIGKMFRRTDDGIVIFQSGYCPTNLVNFARLRAPAGTYRGRFKVRAVQSDTPVTLRIYAGDTIVGRREKHLIGYFDVPPDEWTVIEFEDELVEPNGTFQPKCYGTKDTRKDADTYPEPGIEIGDLTIEGPLERWPPHSRTLLLGEVDSNSGSLSDVRKILQRAIPRAFRRSVKAHEIEPFIRLADSALAADRSFESALRLALKAVLCSPEFLFLDESGDIAITDDAVASRLSYFLWSSMPDEKLRTLAISGTLTDKQVLREQVNRLLDDPRSSAFMENFVGQWLDLRDIDFTTPDMDLYPDYDELLRVSMVQETHLFFREIITSDLSLLNFVDSDFTFLNQRLAEHYGISGIHGQAFRKAALPLDSVRGGLMTQASILKVTANGTTTSPVIRGAWMTEKIAGQTVPPPPSNVSAVEPDIRGAVTLRQQLSKHRDIDSCATCHNKIDPPGFALENFDVIGGWRTNYRSLGKQWKRPQLGRDPHTLAWIRYRIGPAVDASGETIAGETFDGIKDFKKILLRDPRAIAKGVTEKLAVYAIGRRLNFSDRPAIKKIVDRIAEKEYGFKSLVHEIVQSELFRMP